MFKDSDMEEDDEDDLFGFEIITKGYGTIVSPPSAGSSPSYMGLSSPSYGGSHSSISLGESLGHSTGVQSPLVRLPPEEKRILRAEFESRVGLSGSESQPS